MGIILTFEGYKKKKELLDSINRRLHEEIPRSLQRARFHHSQPLDAEYLDILAEKEKLELKREKLQQELDNATVIDWLESSFKSKKIGIGSVVKLKDLTNGKEEKIRVVSPEEADCEIGKISYQSPCGSVLLGKAAGALISVKAPKGVIRYKILEVINQHQPKGGSMEADFKHSFGDASI